MNSWRDADMVRLLNDILPLVSAAERRMVDVTIAYLATAASVAEKTPLRPATPRYKELTGAALRGVDPSVVFNRPQMVLNASLARGKNLTQSITDGESRLRSLGATNLQLSKRATVAAHGQAQFYRRVLTGAENCAMCAIASTQRYRRGNLAPIHPGCDCGIEPIVGDQPQQVIDPELLESIHSEINSKIGFTDRSAQDLGIGKVDARGRPLSDFTDLIVTRNHGELGPTLAWRGDHFRGPVEAASLAG